MAGTKIGGYRAAETNKRKFGPDFYVKIGALGGSKSKGGAFSKNHELASLAGKLGGLLSRKNGKTAKFTRAERKKIKELKERIKALKS